jgi:hypothetical protein
MRRVVASAMDLEAVAGQTAEEAFRHLATTGVPGTYKEDLCLHVPYATADRAI